MKEQSEENTKKEIGLDGVCFVIVKFLYRL